MIWNDWKQDPSGCWKAFMLPIGVIAALVVALIW